MFLKITRVGPLTFQSLAVAACLFFSAFIFLPDASAQSVPCADPRSETRFTKLSHRNLERDCRRKLGRQVPRTEGEQGESGDDDHQRSQPAGDGEIGPLEVADPGVLPQRAQQLPVAGVDREHGAGAALDEHGREAARRGAEVVTRVLHSRADDLAR